MGLHLRKDGGIDRRFKNNSGFSNFDKGKGGGKGSGKKKGCLGKLWTLIKWVIFPIGIIFWIMGTKE